MSRGSVRDTDERELTVYADTLHIALDVTANGRIPQPPYEDNAPNRIHRIDVFLSSYEARRNFTVTNATASAGTVNDILVQEPGSTVKHINWLWPACLSGDGGPKTVDDPR